MKNNMLKFNPSDMNSLRELCKMYGDSDVMLPARSDNGEIIWLSIDSGDITTVAIQKNGWARYNCYYVDGTSEEWFDKEQQTFYISVDQVLYC